MVYLVYMIWYSGNSLHGNRDHGFEVDITMVAPPGLRTMAAGSQEGWSIGVRVSVPWLPIYLLLYVRGYKRI